MRSMMRRKDPKSGSHVLGRRRILIQSVLLFGCVVALLFLLLGPIAWWATPTGQLAGKELAAALDATRQTLLAATVVSSALVGLAFTARTFYLSRRGQQTDRYSKAVAQVASDKLTERIGGVYALEHLLIESSRDHETILEVLAGFVRERVPMSEDIPPPPASGFPMPTFPRPPGDVQAALTVIGRRPIRVERNLIDLRRTDLRGADLNKARLSGVNLFMSYLDSAHLMGTDLRGALIDDGRLPFGITVDGNTQWPDPPTR